MMSQMTAMKARMRLIMGARNGIAGISARRL
jgi:hypothetical protein